MKNSSTTFLASLLVFLLFSLSSISFGQEKESNFQTKYSDRFDVFNVHAGSREACVAGFGQSSRSGRANFNFHKDVTKSAKPASMIILGAA